MIPDKKNKEAEKKGKYHVESTESDGIYPCISLGKRKAIGDFRQQCEERKPQPVSLPGASVSVSFHKKKAHHRGSKVSDIDERSGRKAARFQKNVSDMVQRHGDDSDVFYSFAYSGFSKENKRKRIPNSWRDNYAYYYIEVSDDTYLEMKKKIQNFEDNIESLKYSILEIITAFLNIPFKQKNKFFCSYFVADLLTSTGAYPLSKKSCTYLPHHLAKELENCEHIEYVSNTVSA